MTVEEFEAHGIWLWAVNGRVKYKIHGPPIPPEKLRALLEELRQTREMVLNELLVRQNARTDCLQTGYCRHLHGCKLYPIQPGICSERVQGRLGEGHDKAGKNSRDKKRSRGQNSGYSTIKLFDG